MTWQALVLFNGILLAAWIVPGPAMLIAMQAVLRGGRRAGIAAGLGLAVTAAFWTLLALLGLDALFGAVPAAYSVLKAAGAAYLIWIAWKTFRTAGRADPVAPKAAGRKAFLRGLLSNLYNPKSVLFSAAALALVVPHDLKAFGIAIVTLNHFAFETCLYTALALCLSTARLQRGYLRVRRTVDRVAATLLGALGLRLLLER